MRLAATRVHTNSADTAEFFLNFSLSYAATPLHISREGAFCVEQMTAYSDRGRDQRPQKYIYCSSHGWETERDFILEKEGDDDHEFEHFVSTLQILQRMWDLSNDIGNNMLCDVKAFEEMAKMDGLT